MFKEIEKFNFRDSLITLSGGNPALQPFGDLIELGQTNNYTFALETQGTVFRDWFKNLDHLILSPKPPSSGMPTDMDKLAKCFDCVGRCGEVSIKIVVFDEEDYEYARTMRQVCKGWGFYDFYLQAGNDWVADEDVNPEFRISLKGGSDLSQRDSILNRTRWLQERVLRDRWVNAIVLPQLHVLLHGNQRGV